MLNLHILSLFIYTYLMCLMYLCISHMLHGIKNKELELDVYAMKIIKITVMRCIISLNCTSIRVAFFFMEISFCISKWQRTNN